MACTAHCNMVYKVVLQTCWCISAVAYCQHGVLEKTRQSHSCLLSCTTCNDHRAHVEACIPVQSSHLCFLLSLPHTIWLTCTAAPTLSGESVLNPFHPYGTVRHLHNKPVADFGDDDQYLLIAAAEKEGLLKVSFKVWAASAACLFSI